MVSVLKLIFIWVQILFSVLNPLTYLSLIVTRILGSGKLNLIRSPHSVISIGNLTVGGVGKTPFTLWLANQLVQESFEVSVLNKSYKASASEPGEVTKCDESNLRLFGDEAIIYKTHLLKRGSVFSGPNKSDTLDFLSQVYQERRVILLDDGFQHTKIARNLDIVLIDISDVLMWMTLPFGRGREWIFSLRYAELVLLTKGQNISPFLKNEIRKIIKMFVSDKALVVDCQFKPNWPALVDQKPIIVLSGLARNEPFSRACVDRYGDRIKKCFSFPDHALFTREEMHPVLDYLNNLGEHHVLVTEKDAVKLAIRYPHFMLTVVTLITEVDRSDVVLDFIRSRIY